MSRFPPEWVRRHAPMLVNGICLLAAVWLTAHFSPATALPAKGLGLALAALLFVRTVAPRAQAGFWRQALAHLPGLGVSAAVCIVSGRLIWDWPWTTFTFLPVWLGLTMLTWLRFAPQVTGQRLWASAQRRVAAGDDTALTGALIVGCVLWLFARLEPMAASGWSTWIVPALLWLATDRWPHARWQEAVHGRARLARFFTRLFLWAVLTGGVQMLGSGDSTRKWTAALILVSGAMTAFGLCHRHRIATPSENAAGTLLGLLGVVLIHPFAAHRLLGSQDAAWYLNTLTDFLVQVRAGVFPVFVGQSESLFNGGVLPVRFAPLFHHYGLLLDLVTLHTVTPAGVQNGVIVGCLLGAVFTSYAMLLRLVPGRPWTAAALAALFLTCPGVLAIVYYEDLFMTWTTLPWLPLVFGGCALSLRSPSGWPLFLCGAALGITWWGHAPVALWSTAAVAFIQLVRLLPTSPRRWPWPSLLAAATGFAAIAAYPMISVLAVPVQTGAESLNYTATDHAAIVHFVRESFPGILTPLFWKTRTLSDFQPGWAVLLLFPLGALLLLRQRIRQPGYWALLAVPLGLQLLLLPVPALSNLLWSLLPDFLVNPTGTWPMQRLYVIIAVCGVNVAGLLLGQERSRLAALLLTLVLLVGVSWSVWAVRPFLHAKESQKLTLAAMPDPARPENLVLTRYAYLVFGHQPGYYSHGHMEPRYEQRFLSAETGRWIGGNPDAILAGASAARLLEEGPVSAEILNPGDPWQLTPRFRLQPGRHYVLDLRFNHPHATGVLLINGPGLGRVQGLPTYGEKFAFGSGADASPLLPLHTSGPEPIEVALQFASQPADPSAAPLDLRNFGRYRWLEVDLAALPIRVTGWIPYQAEVDAPPGMWLETPRMFQPGYRATVNGQAVTPEKSPEGLVAVPVPAGRSTVTLTYRPPLLLLAGYWLSATAIVVCTGLMFRITSRPQAATIRNSDPRDTPSSPDRHAYR